MKTTSNLETDFFVFGVFFSFAKPSFEALLLHLTKCKLKENKVMKSLFIDMNLTTIYFCFNFIFYFIFFFDNDLKDYITMVLKCRKLCAVSIFFE